MPLMTLDRWRDKTSKWNSDRKNPLITDLDILIAEYHKANKTDLQKLKLLILIRPPQRTSSAFLQISRCRGCRLQLWSTRCLRSSIEVT